jgi:histidinol-phosphate/aromatic aminotransferase/cobyric acid decarboxylase-like protein
MRGGAGLPVGGALPIADAERQRLAGRRLVGNSGTAPHRNANVHFQYAFCQRAEDVAEIFRNHGIGVRVLGAAHGANPDALRIVAPRSDERERFLGAVADVAAALAASGEAEPAQRA